MILNTQLFMLLLSWKASLPPAPLPEQQQPSGFRVQGLDFRWLYDGVHQSRCASAPDQETGASLEDKNTISSTTAFCVPLSLRQNTGDFGDALNELVSN